MPLTNVISNFIHLVLGFLVFFLYLLVVYIRTPKEFPLQASAVWLPALLIITFMLALGLSFFASAFNTFYEDVKHLVSVALYLMFFMCPIMYFVEQVANSSINRAPHYWVYKLYLLNPFASLCIAYRKILLAPVSVSGPDPNHPYAPQSLDIRYLIATAIFSFIILILGVLDV